MNVSWTRFCGVKRSSMRKTGRHARPSAKATGTRSASSAKKTPKRMRLAVPGSRTVAPVMPRFPGSFPAPISAALCRRRCAGRPTSVRRGTASRSRRRAATVMDVPERQLGEFGDAVQREAREIDAPPKEHAREDEHEHACNEADRGLAARVKRRPRSTTKWVPSRMPTMAPSMIDQMKQKRASSSVQM